MGKEQRLSVRTLMACRVCVTHPELGQQELMLRDLSDTGIFIETDTPSLFSIGDQVSVQVLGLTDEPPALSMTIVRLTQEGIGLQFNDPEFTV